MPKVSVVIPTFNRADTIGDSIKSVLEQTFKDFEVVVVDDGSTDNTESIIASLGDSRIKYVMQDNAGACAARNNGIRHAHGEYIAFQDSDDHWMPRKLEKQLQNINLYNSKIDICKMHSVGLPEDEYEPCRQAIKANFSYEYLLGRNFVSTQMILARHELFEDNLFDVKIPRFQDWDLMLRLLRDHKLSYTDEVLVERYISADSISQNVSKALEAYSLIEK
ncbi:glycosyltransferase family 2 protein, partial [Bifidobacterium moukalabense]